MRNFIILIILFDLSLPVLGQNEEVHKIETELNKCLEDSTTTAGMRGCFISAREEWDNELNRYYKLLMNKVSDKTQKTLKEAQREWISYRDKEFALINNYYFNEKSGTMWHPISNESKLEIVKRRAQELENYYEMLNY